MLANKQLSKLCIASHVNKTTDTDDKAHGAIALQDYNLVSFAIEDVAFVVLIICFIVG